MEGDEPDPVSPICPWLTGQEGGAALTEWSKAPLPPRSWVPLSPGTLGWAPPWGLGTLTASFCSGLSPLQGSQHGGSSTSLASTKVCSSMDENDGPGEGGERGACCLKGRLCLAGGGGRGWVARFTPRNCTSSSRMKGAVIARG